MAPLNVGNVFVIAGAAGNVGPADFGRSGNFRKANPTRRRKSAENVPLVFESRIKP